MKKLMVAAAVAMLGIAANAANAEWGTAEIYEYVKGGTAGDEQLAPNTYLCYYIDAADFSWDDAKSALESGNTGFVATYGKLGEIDGGYGFGIMEGYGDGQSITAYTVVSTADGSAWYLSDTDTQSTGGKGQAAGLGFDTTSSQSGANWYTAVPEPTSGLLLLLGVAGLALRRRLA